MTNDIQIFNNPQFGEVRVVMSESNEPMFCLADVCKALNLTNVSKVKTRLNPKGVTNSDTLTNGGVQSMTYISEANLYKCIFQSRVKKATEFQDWVTDVVLPTIRKTGGYIPTKDDDTAEEIMARALIVAQETLKRKEQRLLQLENDNKALLAINHEQSEAISEMTPKVNYCDVILASPTTVTVTQIAQDYGMTPNKLNKTLAELKIQHRVSKKWVLNKEYIAGGYVQSYTEPNKNSRFGGTFVYTRWTQKGRIFLYNELKNRGILPLIEKCQCPY